MQRGSPGEGLLLQARLLQLLTRFYRSTQFLVGNIAPCVKLCGRSRQGDKSLPAKAPMMVRVESKRAKPRRLIASSQMGTHIPNFRCPVGGLRRDPLRVLRGGPSWPSAKDPAESTWFIRPARLKMTSRSRSPTRDKDTIGVVQRVVIVIPPALTERFAATPLVSYCVTVPVFVLSNHHPPELVCARR